MCLFIFASDVKKYWGKIFTSKFLDHGDQLSLDSLKISAEGLFIPYTHLGIAIMG